MRRRVSEADIVADASAILALLRDEPFMGFDPVHLLGAWISTVNFSEVFARLLDGGLAEPAAEAAMVRLDLRIVPFDREQARTAARLRRQTRSAGLSLGDRACLALALQFGRPAVTADRAWRNLAVGAEIVLIR